MGNIIMEIEQGTLFETLYETKKIDKPIRLIELFAGIGSQYKALKRLGANVESYKIVEWAYNSIIGYNAIHHQDNTDYAKDMSKEDLIQAVKGISMNYNEPMTEEQLSRKGIEWLKNAYNNIKATHNLVNIMNVKGSDLEIVDTDKYEYIMTYSFPCQDLSNAGLKKGCDVSQAEGGTRSGLLWEVERILNELEEKPQILVCENVPDLVNKKNIHNFKKWLNALTSMGYKNYTQVLNGKDYGIPQNRKRVFIVSLLGDYNYTFPRKQKLKLKLKDMLEDNVDEKYYLSDSKLESISKWKAQQDPLKDIDKEKAVSPTITARGAGEEHSGMILINENVMCSNVEGSLFTNQQGEMINEDGNIKRYIHSDKVDEFKEGQVADISYPNGYNKAKRTHDECPAINTTTTESSFITKISQVPLRIRKLTPCECMRLMGFDDEDYKALDNILSGSAIYHIAGDSIIVNVLENIFKQML